MLLEAFLIAIWGINRILCYFYNSRRTEIFQIFQILTRYFLCTFKNSKYPAFLAQICNSHIF